MRFSFSSWPQLLMITLLQVSCGKSSHDNHTARGLGYQGHLGKPLDSGPMPCHSRTKSNHKAIQYVEELIEFIVSKNRDVFGDQPILESICVSDEYDESEYEYKFDGKKQFGGFADYITGRLTITPGMILAATDASNLAMILAHELAHFTMLHGETFLPDPGGEFAADYQKLLANRKASIDHQRKLAFYKEAKEEILVAIVKIFAVDAHLSALLKKDELNAEEKQELEAFALKNPEFQEWNQKLITLENIKNELNGEDWDRQNFFNRALYEKLANNFTKRFGMEAVFNWNEREADEIGHYYFIKAGFSRAQATWAFPQFAKREAETAFIKDGALTFSAEDSDEEMIEYLRKHADVTAAQALASCHRNRALRGNGDEPVAGEYSHPTFCWRVWNLTTRIYRDASDLLMPPDYTEEFRPSLSLEEVKASYQ